MRKYFFRVLVGIVVFLFSLFIFINMVVYVNMSNNKKTLGVIKDIFYRDTFDVGTAYEYEYLNGLLNLEIDGIDYVGVITVLESDVSIPLQSSCDNSFLGIQSGCSYCVGDSLVVIGTGLNDSFRNYNMYYVGDTIVYMNMLGENYHYKITSVKRVDKLDDVFRYDGDILIVVKDYVDMEYVVFVCGND